MPYKKLDPQDRVEKLERLKIRREWCRQNPRYWYRIKHKYGLTPEKFHEMLKSQLGRCKVCNEMLVEPHIDHNHKTEEVRGLLCIRCNTLLGFIEQDFDIVSRCLNYLRGL